MSVHVDEVAARVVPAPSSGGEPKDGSQQRLGAAEEAWAVQHRLARRDDCRTKASGFDD